MEPDPLLRRVERTAAAACGVMAVAALIASGGRPAPALAVVGGWLLIEIAYRAIASAVDVMIEGLRGRSAASDRAAYRRRVVAAVVKIAGRYALLAFLAYVMIVRLRLHPLGLVAGASSAVAAVSIEAVRLLIKK